MLPLPEDRSTRETLPTDLKLRLARAECTAAIALKSEQNIHTKACYQAVTQCPQPPRQFTNLGGGARQLHLGSASPSSDRDSVATSSSSSCSTAGLGLQGECRFALVASHEARALKRTVRPSSTKSVHSFKIEVLDIRGRGCRGDRREKLLDIGLRMHVRENVQVMHLGIDLSDKRR